MYIHQIWLTDSTAHYNATEKFSVRFQPFLNMLHLLRGHVLVYFAAISLILSEVHCSQHILCLLFCVCDLKFVRLVFIMERSMEF